jgi:hypothetical protein
MASTAQQTEGSVTLKGSADLVKKYLGMYNKSITVSYVLSDCVILTYIAHAHG